MGQVQSEAPREPSANSRQLARVARDSFIALVQEGFSESQATRIVTDILASIVSASLKKD